MKSEKLLKKYGGVLLFYILIVAGIFLLNARMHYLNEKGLLNCEATCVTP